MSEKKKILKKEVDQEELKKVSGACGEKEEDDTACKHAHRRDYNDGCAATVEHGSWCKRTDACFHFAVVYH